jgi:dolichol-phosphate mannosyltransferase
MKVSIILPTYNETGNIVNLIQTINRQQDLKKHQLEFVVVDDNSPDGTATTVRQAKKLPIKLIVRKNQRGLATAILAGIKQSTGKIIVLMDTDFNHQPKDISQLIQPIMAKTADLVIGSRYIKGGGMHITEAGAFQFLASKYGNYFVNRILLGLPVHESLSGFLVFDKKILKDIDLNKIFQGYGDYCIRLLHKAFTLGYKLTEVPVIYGKRQYGESKSRLIKMMIDYFKTAVQLKLNS